MVRVIREIRGKISAIAVRAHFAEVSESPPPPKENMEARCKGFGKNDGGKLTREEFIGPSAK